jgi:protein-disulfide isomerase
VAKSNKKPTETSHNASGGSNKTAIYVIGAVVVAAIITAVFVLRDDDTQTANAAKEEPTVGALMEEGPLEDIVLGDPDAPYVIVEYASMTCPHCASFYNNVFPDVKEKYIDTGKARFVFREFPLDGLAVAASMLARCAGEERFYPMIDGLFETQETWAVPGEDGKHKLLLIAKQAGFSQESFEKCLADKELFDKLVAVRKKAHEEFGVDSTPSFFVNGKKLDGIAIENFDAAIEGPAGTPPSG